MSRTIAGELSYHASPSRRPTARVSTFPWFTALWLGPGVLGLLLLSSIGSSRAVPAPAPPRALVLQPAPVVADHKRLEELARRVEALEVEVRDLRSPRVAGR